MSLKDNKLIKGLNGKKIPIVLILTMVSGGIGYGELKNKVANNVETIKSLKPITEQVARIDERVKDLKEDFIDFRGEQRKANEKTESKLEEIFKAVLAK